MTIRLFLLLLIPFAACRSGKLTTDYFQAIEANDRKLEAPLPGEWRQAHNEAHQSLTDYIKLNPKKAELHKTKIYLLPLGRFTGLQQQILELTREYVGIFFQLETLFLEPVSDSVIPGNARRINGQTLDVQLLTPYIFDHLLKGRIPPDGYALMAISEKDLYPSPDWNYVFGIASYEDRIGVSSIYRYPSARLGITDTALFLKRIIATATHEIGHMFSLHHCVSARCAMNGSNSLPESDRQPLRLCSECQRKLNWNIRYDNKKRLKELIGFLKRNRLFDELADLERDYNLVK